MVWWSLWTCLYHYNNNSVWCALTDLQPVHKYHHNLVKNLVILFGLSSGWVRVNLFLATPPPLLIFITLLDLLTLAFWEDLDTLLRTNLRSSKTWSLVITVLLSDSITATVWLTSSFLWLLLWLMTVLLSDSLTVAVWLTSSFLWLLLWLTLKSSLSLSVYWNCLNHLIVSDALRGLTSSWCGCSTSSSSWCCWSTPWPS